TNGDGVAGNPTINLDTTLFPSPIAGDAGKFLKATGANASSWSALASGDVTTALGFTPVNKAGDSLTTGTIALSGTAALTVQNPVNVLDAANKQYVDGFGQWTKGTSANAGDIYRASGNVGIGTTGPQQLLHLGGAGNSALSLFTNTSTGNTSSDGSYVGINPTGNMYVWNQENLPILFGTNNGERMRIDASGNVGIGTSSASAKLQVLGSGTDNSAGDSITLPDAIVTGPNRAFNTALNPANLVVMSNSALGADVGATIGLGGRYTGAQFAQFAMIKGAKENATDGNWATYLGFGTRSHGNNITEKVRIDSSGNVGVGTASPAAKLDVNGEIRSHGQAFPWRWSVTSAGDTAFGVTTWTDIASASITFTLPANADVEMKYDGSVIATEAAIHCVLRFVIDGSAPSDSTTYGDQIVMGTANNWWLPVSRSRWVSNMAAGAHTVKIQGSAQPAPSATTSCRVIGADYSRLRLTIMAYPVQ
ncbi:MAG: hypothetical protein ACXVCE_13320, partial [Bacteriovorax sp.]